MSNAHEPKEGPERRGRGPWPEASVTLAVESLRIDHAYDGLGYLEGQVPIWRAVHEWCAQTRERRPGPVCFTVNPDIASEHKLLLPSTELWVRAERVRDAEGRRGTFLEFHSEPLAARTTGPSAVQRRGWHRMLRFPRESEDHAWVWEFLERFTVTPIPGVDIIGVDHYGMPRLLAEVDAHPRRAWLVGRLFSDGAATAAVHAYARMMRRPYDVPCMTLNVVNVFDSQGIITHRHPQAFLGLLGEPTDAERDDVVEAVRDTLALRSYAALHDAEGTAQHWRQALNGLAGDADLNARDFKSGLGVRVDEELLARVRQVIVEAAAAANTWNSG